MPSKYEPLPEHVQYFDPKIFDTSKNPSEIKLIIAYHYFSKCTDLMNKKLQLKFNYLSSEDKQPYVAMCMSRFFNCNFTLYNCCKVNTC